MAKLSVSRQLENSRTFKDFYCFSRTFQAWNFILQIQGLSRTVGTVTNVSSKDSSSEKNIKLIINPGELVYER